MLFRDRLNTFSTRARASYASMLGLPVSVGGRSRVLLTRMLCRLGLQEDSYLVLLAVLIGILAAVAACGFHLFIEVVRDRLFASVDPDFLYGRGAWLLILWPALGGLVVGLFGRLTRRPSGGVPAVIESVVRRHGFMRPLSTLETIFTAGITIGSGGSAGAEGPIIQIGAGLASGVGRLFRVARHHMPILVGCGCAAGISAIFNAPIGGVLFTIEVILQDFSIRAFMPLVLASVVANVMTQTIFRDWLGASYGAIFAMPSVGNAELSWAQLPAMAGLGLICGLGAVALLKLMFFTEARAATSRIPSWLRPAVGGAALGVMGVLYIVILGWWMAGQAKPIAFASYPMPAFFGDGYGAIRKLLEPEFYGAMPAGELWVLLAVLAGAKILATCLTLGSGGSGGIIAPSLFLGAALGGIMGFALQQAGFLAAVNPGLYALIGMGAVLAAVVRAPLAAILILLELTNDHHVILPAMLCCIAATGLSRLLCPESIYTHALLKRGVHLGRAGELSVLRQITIEQVELEPVTTIDLDSSFTTLLSLLGTDLRDVVVLDRRGRYAGLLLRLDIERALLQPDSIPLLLVGELVRLGCPILKTTDDLASAVEHFSGQDCDSLPVCLEGGQERIIGMLTRTRLMRHYQSALTQTA